MTDSQNTLNSIFDGWNGYHQSIVNAVAPLTQEQFDVAARGQFQYRGANLSVTSV
jgi:hypothetical protein